MWGVRKAPEECPEEDRVAEAMTRPDELTAKQNELTNCGTAAFKCARGGNGHTH